MKWMLIDMPNSRNKKSVNIDKNTYERFEYLYPDIVHIFINRALKLALQDKKYFEEVFFNKMFIEVK